MPATVAGSGTADWIVAEIPVYAPSSPIQVKKASTPLIALPYWSTTFTAMSLIDSAVRFVESK